MSYRTDIVYRYDGSFEGLLTCVFESFACKEKPICVQEQGEAQEVLFEVRRIGADPVKAERVLRGLHAKVGPDAAELIYLTYLTNMENRAEIILEFVHRAMKTGPVILDMLTEETVCAMRKAARHLTNETHLLKGFVRFSEIDGVLVGQITPQNDVLPLLADHFADRYPGERIMLLDKTHGRVLLCAGGASRIVPAGDLIIPEPGEEEKYQRALWRRFYNTIAIEGRRNPKLRMSLMPKRYWGNMTEMQGGEKQLAAGS